MKQSCSTAETDWLRVFISLALPQSRHQLLEDGTGQISAGSTLVLSVHHPNPLMRAAAVKQLGKSLTGENQVHIIGLHVQAVLGCVKSYND